VTASLSDESSPGSLKVESVTSYVQKIVSVFPDPGDGVKPVPIREVEQVQMGQSDGVTPLQVDTGQYVVVAVQFSPSFGIPSTCTATLLIQGSSWEPVSIPVTANAGSVTLGTPAPISVVQGQSTTADFSMGCGEGVGEINLIADGAAESPNVTATLSPASFSIYPGQVVPFKLTVSAALTLPVGKYQVNLVVEAFSNAFFYSYPVSIEVTPHYVPDPLTITTTPTEILIGEPNTITVNATDTKTGAAVDGLQVIVASLFSGTTPESPHVTGVTGKPLIYTPNIDDRVAEVLVLGGATYINNYFRGIGLAMPTPKVTYTGSGGSFTIHGSGFIGNEVEITVDREGLVTPGPFKGNIAAGIPITLDCINPGQYWTIHVQGLAVTSQLVTTNVSC
jgi:hypothetical protein